VSGANDTTLENLSKSSILTPGIASLTFGFLGESDEETVVIGTKGRLTIHTPSHCPTRVTCVPKAHGRGQSGEPMEFDYPVPPETKEQTDAGGYFYPNSAGFCYEAAAVARCIAKGWTEAPQYTLNDTLNNMKIIDELRSQLGVKPIY
jgi:dihydrodiol dehydrogenase / D-xylose 1-dehydrogenase (NADP)